MALITVEAESAGSKLPAADNSTRTYMGGRYGLGASAPLLTRTSPMHFAGPVSSAMMLKLIKLVGPSSTLTEELSPFFTRFAAEAPLLRLPVFVSDFTSAELYAPGLLNADLSLSSSP